MNQESVDQQENEAENERRRSSSLLLPDQLVQPSHLSKSHGPSTNPPLLAVHGPVPVPLTTSIEPDQLVDRPEPGVQNLTGIQKMVFWLPTMFDICGTTLMNSGLLFVPVSVFQMVRGALPLWVGLFSIVFLNRHLSKEKWLSLIITLVSAYTASQFVIEEKIMTRSEVPPLEA
ncbi:hypothetical protein PPACK8108_LOCUS12057, partial [Phakopsora pachyrhizi]